MCHDYYIDRGGEDFVFEYETDLLQRKGYNLILYCKYNKNIDGLIKKLGVVLNFFFSFKTFREIKKIIKEEKPDVAHVHNIFPLISFSIYFILRRYKIPIVQTIHNFRFFCSNGLCLRGGKICTECIKNRFINIFKVCSDKKIYDFFISIIIYLVRKFKIYNRVIDYFVVPSIFLRDKMVECGFSNDKIVVKRNSSYSKKIFLKENYYESNYGNKYFLFIGRLSREKGINNLIKIFSRIDNIELKILGNGPLEGNIKGIINKYNINNVKMLGYIDGDSKDNLIANSMAVIIPSICFEAGPLVLIESLMLGVPVVANNNGTLSEYIANGYNGYIYSNFKQLQRIVLDLNSMKISERYKLRENCRESFLKLFDEDTNFKIVDGIYKKLRNPSKD